MTPDSNGRHDSPPEGAQWVHAAGGSQIRGVIQGDRVVGNIISTGDHARFFVGAHERVGESYLQPWSVFHRVRLDRFAGRTWLIEKVEAFLREKPRGYFILEAAAGLGKTTFMAQLVKRWGCPHHFVETTPGPEGVGPALKSLVAQLLPGAGADEVLPGAAARPDYLQTLLFEAARARDASSSGTPIVVVVDGLDEAGTPAGQNVLGLPRVLPDGVYFVVSQRPVEVSLDIDAPREVYRLEAGHAPNLRDMRLFLLRTARRGPVRAALAEAGSTPAEFTATLLDRSGGVWVYLHCVVEEIERGERLPLNLGSLPRGVWQYYAQHWQRWRNRRGDAWDADLRVLATLAAAQDELSISLLAALAGIPDDAALRRLLEQWQPYLTMAEAGEPRYRLYHASLREFLDGRAETLELTTAERALTRELADATRAAHARIADFLLSTWGGLDAGLPGLGSPDARTAANRYGIRHLGAHLEAAGRAPELHRLLGAERTSTATDATAPNAAGSGWLGRLASRAAARHRASEPPRNVWYTVHEQAGDVAGYLADLERAWRLADEAGLAAVRGTDREAGARAAGGAAVLGLRYALVQASINSLAENVPPALLPLLVREGMWHPIQALAYARHVPDAAQRAEALTRLIPCLPDRADEVAREALRAVDATQSFDRLAALQRLVPHLPPDSLRHLLANLDFYAPIGHRTLLLWIARHAPASLLQSAVESPNDTLWLSSVELVGVLSDFLPDPRLMDAVLDTWWFVSSSAVRIGDVLLARHLPEPDRSEILPAMIAALPWEGYGMPEPELIPMLLPHMSDEAVRHAVATLLELGLQTPHWQSQQPLAQLAALSPRLAHVEKLAVADSVFERITALKAFEHEDAARSLVPHLAAMGIADELLTRAAATDDADLKCGIIEGLAAHLPEPAVRSAFLLLHDHPRHYATRDARSALLLRLAELGHADEALRDAPEEVRTAAWLSTVAAFVDPARRRPVVEAALSVAGDPGSRYYNRSRFDVAAWGEIARLRTAPEDLREVPDAVGTEDEDLIAPVLAALPEARRAPWLKELSWRLGTSSALRARALVHLLPGAGGWRTRMITRRILRLAGRPPNEQELILAEAAMHLSGRAQAVVIRKVLDLARVPTAMSRRTFSLMAPHLPPEMVRRVLRPHGHDDRQWELLPLMADALTQTAVQEFRAARDEEFPGRIYVLAALAPRVAELGHVDEVVRAAAEVEGDARKRLLASVATYLDVHQRGQMWESCTARMYGVDEVATAVALLHWQTEVERASALPKILDFVRQHLDDKHYADRLVTIILQLLPHVSAGEQAQLLDDAVHAAEVAVLDTVDWWHDHGALQQIVRHVAGCEPATRMALWQSSMRRLARRSRRDLVEALGSLVPLLSAIGGADAVLAARETMTAVLRDWK